MFGHYALPFQFEKESIKINIEKNEKGYLYKRECLQDTIERFILMDKAKIIINPVEPINTPLNNISFLLVEFKNTVTVQPKIRRKIYLSFPIEICVFLSKKNSFETFDIFSLAKKKLTLYGEPNNGVICKYWQSDIFLSLPDINPLIEGIVELSIQNTTSSWVDVHKVLLKGVGMKIYYNDSRVVMRAEMKISEDNTAEVSFKDLPYSKDMEKSLEIYTMKKLSITSAKSLMMEGI